MEKSQNRKPFQALRDLFHPVDLTHGTCWRTILQFSLPVILSYLLQQVYTISDAAIVGQTLTAQEVAGAVGVTRAVLYKWMTCVKISDTEALGASRRSSSRRP